MSHSRLAASDDTADLDQCPNCGNLGPEDGEIRGKATAFKWQYCDCGWQSDIRGFRLIRHPGFTAYEFDPSLLPEAALFQKLHGNLKLEPNAFRFSEDARQLVWMGTTYALTRNQAAIVKVLYEQYQLGTRDIHTIKLMSLAGSLTSSPRDSFAERTANSGVR